MEKTVGSLCESTFSFKWKIENFSSLSDKNAYKYQSPPFHCFDAVWQVLLYPNGDGQKRKGWISVFLSKLHPKDSKHMVDMKFIGKCGDKIMSTRKFLNVDFSVKPASYGVPIFLKRNVVMKELRTSLQNVFTISCLIMWNRPVADTEPQGSSLEDVSTLYKPKASVEALVRNLKELYVNQSNCDFTINVKDQVFTAHKSILGARSSVFAANFAHDMAENLSGTMKIDDFEPDIVKVLLMYMYTGDVENLSWKNVFDLYVISDKYDVQGLKKESLVFMKSKLCLETVCTVLLLAEKYTETELLKFAKDFVAKCAPKLLTSDHWKRFESENVLLADKVLKMIVLDNAWRIK